MRNFLVMFLTIFIALPVWSQNFFHKMWDYRYGGSGGEALSLILSTIDTGYILAGISESNISGDKTEQARGSYDYWIVKLDHQGNKQWDRRFGGTGYESLHAVVQINDGGYLIGGSSGSSNTGDQTEPTRGGGDYWVVKIDASGDKLWDKRYGGTGNDYLYTIIESIENGYLLGGVSNSGIGGDKTQENWDTSHFYDDGWVIRIDSLGNKLWDRRYGGTGQDDIRGILQTVDRGYLLGCYSASDSDGDKTQPSWGFQRAAYWVVKTDSIGNKQWDFRYGGTGGEYFSDFSKTKDGGYVLCGNSASDSSGDKTVDRWNNSWDYWMVKVDSSGNKQWDRNFGGTYADEVNQVIQTSDLGFLLSGSSQSDISGDKTENNLNLFQTWMVKTDSMGYKQWDKTVFTTGPCGGGYVVQANDGCYVVGNDNGSGIGGYKTQTSWNNSSDYWIMKFCMDTVTSIDNEQLTISNGVQMTIYPNPFSSDVSIALRKESLKEAIFTITNLAGQIIYRKDETNLANSYTKMLDLSYLSNGVYLLEAIVDGERLIKQIVKQ